MRIARLIGRSSEREAVDHLVDAVRSGHGGALVVHGDAGIGKSAMLDYAAASATGLRVVRDSGVPGESTLAFAALRRLCTPVLDHLDDLPPAQRDALRVCFGLTTGPAPDPFLVGLATHGLLAAGSRPDSLVCLVDDVQWWDSASARALAFAARRFEPEATLLLLAAREPGGDFDGLPELGLRGLPEQEADQLLRSVLLEPVDQRVRDQVLAEARGNPMALLHSPPHRSRSYLTADLQAEPPSGPSARLAAEFRVRLESMPTQARQLLVIAAAEPIGEPSLIRAAAEHRGLPDDVTTVAVDAGLLHVDTRVRFSHPLARFAAYRHATLYERRAAHGALADAMTAAGDADRRAWHRAQAAAGPDDRVAAELLRWAHQAGARGGLPAAAAFLERAAALTTDPDLRAGRTLTAADAMLRAGGFGAASDLLATVTADPSDPSRTARGDHLRARLQRVTGHEDATRSLFRAARRLERHDPDAARTAYLDALSAAPATSEPPVDPAVPEAARAALHSLTVRRGPSASDLLLSGFATLHSRGYAHAVPHLRDAVTAWEAADGATSGAAATAAALHLWDDEAWDRVTARLVGDARQTGARADLVAALIGRVPVELLSGRPAEAAVLVDEIAAVTGLIGSGSAASTARCLAVFQGVDQAASAANDRRRPAGDAAAGWATAVGLNSLGRYAEAGAVARSVTGLGTPGPAAWAWAELAEAAARTGRVHDGQTALRRLADLARFTGTDWALGIEARSRAVSLTRGNPEHLFREAVERLGRTRLRVDLARAHLVYGEWLRRVHRRVDAREQLRTAVELFAEAGVDGFGRRARRELGATGANVRKRTETGSDLTAQELHIARLARAGLSNPEISVELFISARTVEWHLRKVFGKLGISSRRQLRLALTDPADDARPGHAAD
ncbi:helix-turn-helix transcriptional regulator [Hamadaea tsunoensis]|uniref:helix-turn-helix transcriptional regulator n=1 Tax=Hamadaea tsunoensis TaxID=53368 RepID=UPI0003FCA995|nr:LuxR family transcriptional regulator [Hamadaea tsunoensis]